MAVEFNEGYVKDIAEIGERCKSNSHRLDEVEDEIKIVRKDQQAIYDIAASVKIIAQDMTYVKTDVAEVKKSQMQIKSELADVKAKPEKAKAQWMDKAIGAVIGAVGAGVLAFLLNTLCPSIFG